MTEINKDFYCSAPRDGDCQSADNWRDECCGEGCPNYHRKHPTPEQFEAEYGFKWEGAVYHLMKHIRTGDTFWSHTIPYDSYPYEEVEDVSTVCACTPFGCPDDKWRPG